MITVEQIKTLVIQKITGTGIFLVEVSIHPGNSIVVHIDKPEGLNIDECVEVTRHINANLDRDKEDYNLEVSSPGLGSTFKVKEQYLKNIGRSVEVVLKDGEKYKGILLNYTDQEIEMEILVKDKMNKKSKKLIAENIKIAINDIKSTKSIISFKNE